MIRVLGDRRVKMTHGNTDHGENWPYSLVKEDQSLHSNYDCQIKLFSLLKLLKQNIQYISREPENRTAVCWVANSRSASKEN